MMMMMMMTTTTMMMMKMTLMMQQLNFFDSTAFELAVPGKPSKAARVGDEGPPRKRFEELSMQI